MELPLRLAKSLEIWQKFQNVDIEKEIQDSERILDALISMQQAVVDSKPNVPDWEKYIDTLTTKFILHTNSILTLAKGSKIDSKFLKLSIHLIDLPTMLVVIRAQLECFLIFDFIYINPRTVPEKEFRYWNWEYDNLLMRSKLPPKSNLIISQQKDDLKEINELKINISNSPFFMKFSKNQRKQILLTGNAKLFNKWDDLIVLANLNTKLFKGLYPILSSFAHTGAHSLMNLKDQKLGYNKAHSGCQIYLFLSKMVLAHFIIEYKKIFKAAEIKFNLLPADIIVETDLYYKHGHNIKI